MKIKGKRNGTRTLIILSDHKQAKSQQLVIIVFKTTQMPQHSPDTNKHHLLQKLEERKFFKESFEGNSIAEITHYIEKHQAFDVFAKLVQAHEFKHFALTKIILVVYSLLQVDSTVPSNSHLDSLLTYLNERAVKLVTKQVKTHRRPLITLSPGQIFEKMEQAITGPSKKERKNSSSGTETQGSFLIHTVLQPLLNILSRIVANYDQVYRSKSEMNDELCWAFLNFLNKIGEFHKAFEDIGRYYLEDFGQAIFEVVKALDFDIQFIYRKMAFYLKQKIKTVEKQIMKGRHERLSKEQMAKIRQILIFVGQIDKLNDNLRVIYLGKYFVNQFVSRGLRNVILFRGAQTVDSLGAVMRIQEELNSHHLHLKQQKQKSRNTLNSNDTDASSGTQKSARSTIYQKDTPRLLEMNRVVKSF